MLAELKDSEVKWGKSIELPSSRELRSTAHAIGARYPCRSVALIPRIILSEINDSEAKVLDPFMGSGTTAIESSLKGFMPFGLEVDPYARLISDLSIHTFSSNELKEMELTYKRIIKNFASCQPDKSLSPLMKNIDYWFTNESYNNLLKLKTLIHINTVENEHIRRFFLAVMADIVRAVSKAERQSLKPYISKRFAKNPIPALPTFEKAFIRYFIATSESSEKLRQSKISWLDGDATDFTTIEKMDIAITSPPYINAMDYIRCIKLESSWVGTGNDEIFSNLRKEQVGESARSKSKVVNRTVQKIAGPYLGYLKEIDMGRYRTAMTYFQDMHDNLSCVRKALKTYSSYHLIIGNSVLRDTYVPTHEIIAKIAEEIGYEWHKYIRYPIKDHRTSLPRNGRGGKIAEEHVISLQKT